MYTFRLIVSVLVGGVIWTPSPVTAQARGVTPPAPKVPLVVDLVVVGAVHEPSKGEYESIVKIDTVSTASFGYTVSGDVDGRRFTVNRKVRTEDLAHAHEWRPRYKEGDPAIYPGTTGVTLSADMLSQLKGNEQTSLKAFIAADP